MNRVVLLLGSNLGDRNNNLALAIQLIMNEIGEILNQTEIIETEAVEFESDNLFLNQAIEIKTQLSPIQLLKSIKKIEKKIGRKQNTLNCYTDREIDIDIIYFNFLYFYSQTLKIPHLKHTKNREFSIELLKLLK